MIGQPYIQASSRRAVARVRRDSSLVLVVRVDDLDYWRAIAVEQGWVTRLVGSPIVVVRGAACVYPAGAVFGLRAAVAA